MQTAHIVDQAVTGTKMQMIGIGELDLTFQLAQLHGVDTALNGGTCTHVHENGGLNVTVYGMEHTPARTALLLEKFKHRFISFQDIIWIKRSVSTRRSLMGTKIMFA
jgi:hypothetical protein